MRDDSTAEPRRTPQAFDADDRDFVVTPAAPQPAAGPAPADADDGTEPPLAMVRPLRPGWGTLLLSAVVTLGTLAASLWFARFASVAVFRDDWLGWIAKALAAAALLAVAVLILRELWGLLRLRRLTKLRRQADTALRDKDRRAEEAVVARLKALARLDPARKWDLDRFREDERHQRAPGELLAHADTVLMARPDAEARRIIAQSTRRVTVMTAVVPFAFLIVILVLAENLRMLRRLAGAYGGRPGFFGSVRLMWRIVAHIIATGAVALTDDLLGQFLGQDIVHRLSRRAGEGIFNGALTARVGALAVEVCRPLPFIAAKPIRMRDFAPGIRSIVGATRTFFGKSKDAA